MADQRDLDRRAGRLRTRQDVNGPPGPPKVRRVSMVGPQLVTTTFEGFRVTRHLLDNSTSALVNEVVEPLNGGF
jgi:hypothetical protein